MSFRHVEIAISDLEPNPFRDFTLYPIDKEQVGDLTKSIGETGFWGGVSFRPHPTKAGVWQIAAGHHRIEAAKKSGLKKVWGACDDYSDDLMVGIMVTENMTQRGYSPAAVLDSVSAVMKRLSYMLLSDPEVSAIAETYFSSPQAQGSARGKLEKGDGVGVPLILSFAPNLKRRETDEAVASLKASGRMGKIVGDVQKQVEAENKAKVKAAKAAEKEAASADEKMAAKKAAEAAERAAKKADEAAKKAEEATSRKPVTFDDRVAPLFENQNQLKAFREAVTSEASRQYIPLGEQYEIAENLIKKVSAHHKDQKRSSSMPLSASQFSAGVYDLVRTRQGADKKRSDDDRKRSLENDATARIEAELGNVRNAMSKLATSVAKLNAEYKAWKDNPELPSKKVPVPVIDMYTLDAAISGLQTLKKRLSKKTASTNPIQEIEN